jgi:hypothetical protein
VLASAHIAAGAVAGMAASHTSHRSFPRIAAAFCLGLLSHVLMDRVPHGDYAPLAPATVLLVASAEILVSGAVVFGVLRSRVQPRWAEYLIPGLLGACLPDMKFAANVLGPSRVSDTIAAIGDRVHEFFHSAPPDSLPLAWSTEIACALVLFAALTLFPRTSPAPENQWGQTPLNSEGV